MFNSSFCPRRTPQAAPCIAVTACLLWLLETGGPVAAQPVARDAAREADVVEFVAKLEQTRGALQDFCDDKLPEARKLVRELTGEGGISADASKTLLDRIELVEGKLAPALEEAGRYADALGLAQSYADLKEKTVFVYKTVELAQQVHHPLQKDLLYLSAVLKKVEVPVLDAPLKAYAEITEQLVLLTEKVRKKIESNLMGYHVGGAVPIYLNYKTQALFEFFGNDKAKYAQYEMAPQGPEHVYRPVGATGKRVMIWDESARTWYLVRPEATTYDEVERIYHDSLLAGHLLDAAMLYRYTQAPTYEKLQETRQLARTIQKYLNGIEAFIEKQLFPAPDLVGAWRYACNEVELPFDKPWEFEARFAFSHAFRTKVRDFFHAFHDGFCRQQCPDCAKNAALVRQRAVKFGMQDAASWTCELTPRWVLPVGELPLQSFAGIGWLYDQPMVERKYNVVIARVGQTHKATVAIENLSLDTSGDWYEHLDDPPWRWKSLRTSVAPTGQVVNDDSGVTVFVEEEEWGTREYKDGKTEDRDGKAVHRRVFSFNLGFPGLSQLTAFDAPATAVEAVWGRGKAKPQPTAPDLFAGPWEVRYFGNAAGTGEPKLIERWQVVVAESAATAFQLVRGQSAEHASGPLTDNGRTWNATHAGGGLRFANLRLAPDGNRFAGSWSSGAPHNGALVGTRIAAPPPDDVPPTPPPGDSAASGPREVVVELQGLTREIPVTLAAGGRLLLRRAVAAGNPYTARLAEYDRAQLTLVGERTEASAGKAGGGGKPRLGAPTQQQAWEFRAADAARGTARVVLELRRPWESAASIRYTIVVQFDGGR